ncbi:MAG: PP2C family protein-serine/threonine phosphatase, partial [Geoalkalibacter sp.]|uniref:PP2C family protein-serine/threonine phosphatase n=1 Tax=Geoalkalibacter sp. TaxID=3041440 RepID=UPI003D0AB16D
YLHYDAADRRIMYANAGHNPPLLRRSESNNCEWLDAEGLILGVKPSIEFIEIKDQLHPGDMVLLYTDGITEAENDRGEFFGRERLCGLLKENSDDDPKKVIDKLLDQVRLFTGVQHFNDDVTMAILKIQK